MPPIAISPMDAISPAIERTKQLLFRPFNWSRWWRVGLLGLVTGEILSGGGCNPGSWANHPAGKGSVGSIPGISQAQIALVVTTLVVGVPALVLVHLYIASVLRFVLFSGTINGNFRLRQGWKHWHGKGLRYFGFQLAFGFVVLLLMLPVAVAAWKAFSLSKGSIVGMFSTLLVLLPIVLLAALFGAIFHVFVKDFCVPMVAIEDLPMLQAIRRVWRMMQREVGNYAGYLLTKVMLVIVIGIVLFIVQMVVFLIALIPVVIVGVAVGVSIPSIFQNPVVLAGAVVAGLFLIAALLVLFAVIAAPVAAFYQSYVLEFFASRYEPLWNLLHPAPVVPPIPEPPPIPIG